jgi:hypothetical protein
MRQHMTSKTRESRKLTIPYYFSRLAQRRNENLELGDYVKVRGLDKKYELMDVFPRFGSVLVREVGAEECMTVPWNAVSPWKKEVVRSKTEMQAIGSWIFGGCRVYTLDQPNRMLKQRKIHWDRQTCDVEDEDGRVFLDVPWTNLEFWDDVEFNIPDGD